MRQLAEPEPSSGLDRPQAPVEGASDLRVVGTLDLFASRALAGQALIGEAKGHCSRCMLRQAILVCNAACTRPVLIPLCLLHDLTYHDKDPSDRAARLPITSFPPKRAGRSRQAAYLANVCVSGVAQRQGVGQALLTSARREAAAWGEHARGTEPAQHQAS